MDLRDVAAGIGLAVAVGALLGIEREAHAQTKGERAFGGSRTFPLIALGGAVAALLANTAGPWALALPFLVLAGFLALAYSAQVRREPERQGITSMVAALLAFGLGALPLLEGTSLAYGDRLLLTGALAAVVMSLLALREPLHELARRVSPGDLYATVRFILLAAVALPLLPDEPHGPYGVINPFRLGIVVVLLAGISFLGYVAVRALGARRGLGLTAAFGGLVSSTAVTLTFSERARTHPKLTTACAFAVVLASTIMFPRQLLEVLALRPELLLPVSLPVGAMLVVGAAASFVLWRRAADGETRHGDEPTFENPFRLREAVRLGALYALIRWLAAAAHDRFGEAGLHASAALAGLTDVDAITLSVARMHAQGLDTQQAVRAIVVASIANTLVKAVMAGVLGGRRVGLRVGAALLPAALVGATLALLAD